MEYYCRKCGKKVDETRKFCPNCGEKVVIPPKTFLERYKIPLVIVAVILLVLVSYFALVPHMQTVSVDNVKFEIPSDYVNLPDRTDVSYDGNVKSSAMGWSNDKNYIEIGITRTPGSGIDAKEVAAEVGGTPTKMFGYDGYYQKYDDEAYSSVFGMKDKVCMIYVSNHDAFDDVKVIG